VGDERLHPATRTEAGAETVDLPARARFVPGQVLGGRYEVLALLGRGGMGEVWHARDLKLRVEIALKALREDLFRSDRRLELLRQEVRAAREVVSPNVCRVFDLVEVEERELVAMEYVDGRTLLDLLRERGPLELKEAQDIASQFLSGLEAIHRTGLVHRDLKPENIMVTRTGRVVVMDFGLARQEVEGSGSVSGTPAYMSPEQAAGAPVDARADVYSAGVVLAEMVCPEGLTTLESRNNVWQGVRSEPARVPDTPWAPVLKRAVAKDREARFRTAHTLTRALEDVTLRVDLAEDLHPYPGLAAFTETDAEYFFGREAEVEMMWRKLGGPARMLAIVGPSGAGKSSFLRAGLIPAMGPGWAQVLCTPGDSPRAALRRALITDLEGDTEALRELAEGGDGATVSAAARWRRRHDHAMVVVDQFEETFTLNDADEQRRFADLLGRLALEADLFVLLSMRDDFLIHCNRFEGLQPLFAELTALDPPVGTALRRALTQPALRCGYRFEDDRLVDEMLAEVEGERGALPLLAFAAAALWERRDRDSGLITRESYHAIGGVAGALARHAEATLERIGSDRTAVVRELLRNLVTAEGTRAVREWGELLSVFPDAERDEADEVLRALVDARLLTSYELEDEDRGPQRRVEIIHESLLAAWPRLVRWQTQDREGAQLRDELRQAARSWHEHGRQDDRLWTGVACREFELWSERYPGGLSELESEFAAAMRSLAGRRRRRRRLVVASAGAVLLATLAVVTGLWRHSAHQTRLAEASKLITLGHVALEDSRTDAVAYALAALERADTTPARRLALKALWTGPPATVSSVGPAPGQLGLAFSPDGRFLAMGDLEGSVRVHAQTGDVVFEQGEVGRGIPPVVDFSPDGRHLAGSAIPGAAIRIWQTGGWHEVASFQVPGARFGYGVFEADPEDVVTGVVSGADPTARSPQLAFDRWSLEGDRRVHLGGLSLPVPPVSPAQLLVAGRLGLVATALGTEVRIHSLEPFEGEEPRVLVRRAEPLSRVSMAFDPAGERLALAESDGRLSLLPMAEPVDPVVLEVPAGDPMATAFSPDGSRLAQALDPSGVAVWDLEGPAGAGPLVVDRRAATALAFSPDGRWLAVSAGRLELFPVTRRFVRILEGHDGPVATIPSSIAFAADGSALYTQGATDGRVVAWDLTGRQVPGRSVLLQTGPAYGIGLAPDPKGRFVVVSTEEALWSVPTRGGAPQAIDRGERAGRFLVAPQISDSGRFVAGATDYGSPAVQVIDLESDRRWLLEGPGEGPAANWSFDLEDRVVVTRGGVASRWDPPSGATETLVENVQSASPYGDGRLYVLEEGRRWLVDLEDGTRTEFHLQGRAGGWTHQEVGTGTVFARGNRDGSVLVWSDPDSPAHLLVGHEGGSVARISPDGRWIATHGEDGTARLWPMPDLSRAPLHALPHGELVARLRALTNLRAVPDEESYSGYRLEPDLSTPRGWAEVPQW